MPVGYVQTHIDIEATRLLLAAEGGHRGQDGVELGRVRRLAKFLAHLDGLGGFGLSLGPPVVVHVLGGRNCEHDWQQAEGAYGTKFSRLAFAESAAIGRSPQPSQCGLLLDDVLPVVAVDRHGGCGALEQCGPLFRFSFGNAAIPSA